MQVSLFICAITHQTQPVGSTAAPSQRPRQVDTPEEEVDVDVDESQHGGGGSGSGSLEQLSKSLVRYALSCELARKPIKRQDVNEKGWCML